MSSFVIYLHDSNSVLLGKYEQELLGQLTGTPMAESVPLAQVRQLLDKARQGAAAMQSEVLKGLATAMLAQLEEELPPLA